MPAFEDFVSTELPLRAGLSGLPAAGTFPRFTGVGRGLEARTAVEVLADIGALKSDGSIALSGDLSMGGNQLVNVGTPAAGTDAATKDYVDAIANGLDWKASVRVATTAPGTLSSDFENGDTVDGVALVTGDRILLKNQSAGEENGIYIVAASGAPVRAADADVSDEVTSGMSCLVSEGTSNADKVFVLTTNDPIVLGTTALVFAQLAGGSYTHPNHTGDVTSVGDGATTIANNAVTYTKMQDVSATDRILGRSTAGAGDPEEIVCTAAGRALLDDANAAAQRSTLGLGTMAEVASPAPIANGGTALTAAPTQALYLSAESGKGKTTAGAGGTGGLAEYAETTTNAVPYFYLAFAANEKATWRLVMPDNWNGGDVVARFHWTAASGSGTVIFGIKGRAYANDAALDQALGTQQTATDTLLAAGDVHTSLDTSAMTFAGSPTGGQFVVIEVERTGGTLAVDARLIGVTIEYGTSGYSV